MTKTLSRLGMLLSVLPLVVACGDSADSNGGGDVPWVGQTYTLKIPDASWTQPSGTFGAEVGGYVPSFVFSLGAAAGSSISVTAGTLVVPEEGQPQALEQELCNPTTAASLATTAYPNSQLGPFDLPLYLKHGQVAEVATVYGATFTNVLPDGATPATGSFQGTIDFRQIYPLFTAIFADSADDVCNAMQTFDPDHPINCEPCPTDSEPYCLSMRADNIGAEAAATPLPLQTVAPAVDPTACLIAPLQ